MKKLSFVLSLSTDANDFQLEMASAAHAAAAKLGVSLQILYAENDPLLQIEQLLKVIQSPTPARVDGVLFQPISGPLGQVARAAAAAGVAVVVLNWRVDYIRELRQKYQVPAFIHSSDQTEIGRIQAEQITALLPQGGQVLYIQGPSASMAAQNRLTGMMEKRSPNIQPKIIKAASWTEDAGYQAVSFWLSFSTTQTEQIDLIVGQNDLIAMGARKAFSEIANEAARERWMTLPFTGVDGLPGTGQTWVHKRLLAATVAVPPNAGLAIEALTKAVQSRKQTPECIITKPRSFPSIEELKRRRNRPYA